MLHSRCHTHSHSHPRLPPPVLAPPPTRSRAGAVGLLHHEVLCAQSPAGAGMCTHTTNCRNRSLPTPSRCSHPQELLGCYALIGRLGRGAVYFGSARLAQGSAYWERAVRLAERVSSGGSGRRGDDRGPGWGPG